ncbi:MAG: hypothetical protein PVI26_02145 [Chitinispirillia bacterium]|jgi:hypothetical protein
MKRIIFCLLFFPLFFLENCDSDYPLPIGSSTPEYKGIDSNLILLKDSLQKIDTKKPCTVKGMVKCSDTAIKPENLYVYANLKNLSNSTSTSTTQPDSRGFFLIDSVYPGTYTLYVNRYFPPQFNNSDSSGTYTITVEEDKTYTLLMYFGTMDKKTSFLDSSVVVFEGHCSIDSMLTFSSSQTVIFEAGLVLALNDTIVLKGGNLFAYGNSSSRITASGDGQILLDTNSTAVFERFEVTSNNNINGGCLKLRKTKELTLRNCKFNYCTFPIRGSISSLNIDSSDFSGNYNSIQLSSIASFICTNSKFINTSTKSPAVTADAASANIAIFCDIDTVNTFHIENVLFWNIKNGIRIKNTSTAQHNNEYMLKKCSFIENTSYAVYGNPGDYLGNISFNRCLLKSNSSGIWWESGYLRLHYSNFTNNENNVFMYPGIAILDNSYFSSNNGQTIVADTLTELHDQASFDDGNIQLINFSSSSIDSTGASF